jgi:peptidoglycan/LPS O-acetylase OafA/YrhL
LPQKSGYVVESREPVLDGIRGLAILLVVFHHVVIFSGIARTGLIDRVVLAVGASAWIGVDLFFALSGFLITGILYDARSSNRYFTSFYGRRVLRIFPLYYGFLCAWLVFRWFGSTHAEESPVEGLRWYWLYLSNLQVALWGWQQPLHLGHFWSLAVEEQFYLVWPLVVRIFDRRRLLQICVACFAAAFAIRLFAPFGLSALGSYVLMPTRMDSLAAGAVVALIARGPGGLRRLGAWPARSLIASILAVAAIFLSRRGLPETDPLVITVGLSLLAVGAASLIAVVLLEQDSRLHWFLSAAPLVTLGQYSYGLYVFHQPVALLLRDAGWQVGMFPTIGGSGILGLVAFGGVVCLASGLCAFVSWHVWEAPFLRLKRYLPYQTRVAREDVLESKPRVVATAGLESR